MLSLLFTTLFFALTTAAAPTPKTLPTISLRLLGPALTHYTPSTQHPSLHGHVLTLPLGTQLSSLAQNPLEVQGIEVLQPEATEEGGTGSGIGQVWCKINFGYSSQGVVVGMGEGVVMLDGGRVVEATGVGCWSGSKSGA